MTENIWYEKLAKLHEIGTFGDWFYKAARKKAIKRMSLESGATVFNIFCGTGADFPHLQEQIGNVGSIYAYDGSAAMLKAAQKRARKLRSNGIHFHYRQSDFQNNSDVEKLCSEIQIRRPSHILFSLGLTCLPNWKTFSARVLESAPEGTLVCVIDIHSPKLTPEARFLNWIGSADCQQPVWQELKRYTKSFELEQFKPIEVFNLSLIVAQGRKVSPPCRRKR